MASVEKTEQPAVAEEGKHMESTHVEDVEKAGRNILSLPDAKELNVNSVALADALARDKPSPWSSSMIKLYGIIVIVTLNNMMNGFDGSLMGSVNAMKPYHTYFNVGEEGGGTGIVFAIYSVGGIVGAFFAATASDKFGRRIGMFTGSFLIVIGVIVEASCGRGALGQLMGGRFLIGFGMTVATVAAPVYLVEMAHPKWRGIFGGLYNVVGYYSGAIICNWTTYGTEHLNSNWSWRIPTIIQGIPSVMVLIAIFFMPESPRWLWANNKQDTAREVVIKYHGNGNPDSAVVELEIREIEELISEEVESSDKRFWDYRALFDSRAKIYRMWLLLLVSIFSQFIGGSVISYYMPVMLNNIGLTDSGTQLLISALNTVFSFLGGIFGSFMVDRWGRRNLFLWATFLTGLCYISLNVIAHQASKTGHVSTGAGYAFIAFIYLYGIFFSFGWTPLQALYPAEILTNEIRAKGMALQGLLGSLASFINLYATPVALKNIGWKTYTIFLVLHFVQLFLMWLTVVETKGKTLEELDEIFQDRHPVKKSLQKHRVIVRMNEGVKLELS